MGLDSFAYHVAEDQAEGDFNYNEDKSPAVEFYYWRKNYPIHNWMDRLYRAKGGQDKDFNCVKLRLTIKDLDNLEKDIKSKKMFRYEDFYAHQNEEYANDLNFINEARILISEGKAVYYDSWW
jgi:hypothetical protein